MARPIKCRKIEYIPTISSFIPSTEDNPDGPKNILLIEELEAIRLKDLEGLDQADCAVKMQVSRPTFQRILLSARKKIADSLIYGKIIHVDGGNYTNGLCPVKCVRCHKSWTEHCDKKDDTNYTCPSCGSQQIQCMQGCQNKTCHKSCHSS